MVFVCDTAIGSNTACLSVPTLGTQTVFLIFHGRANQPRGRALNKSWRRRSPLSRSSVRSTRSPHHADQRVGDALATKKQSKESNHRDRQR